MLQNIKFSKSITWLVLMFAFAFIGLGISGYLWYEYEQPSAIGCSFNGGCEQVRNSEFSQLWGVDLPVWGIGYYLGITILIMLAQTSLPSNYQRFLPFVIPLYTFSGFLFSLYLTYLEVFVIHALCQWCLASAIAATACFVCGAVYGVVKREELKN